MFNFKGLALLCCACLTVAGCATTEASSAASSSTSEASHTVSPSEASSAKSTEETSKPETTPEPTASESSLPPRVDTTASYGESRDLRYFSVTVGEPKKEETTISWPIKLCSLRPSSNGASTEVSVSLKPWKAKVIDGEGGAKAELYPVTDFNIDTATGSYQPKAISPGQCNEGKLKLRHGNPDLQWLGLDYQSSDGDHVFFGPKK